MRAKKEWGLQGVEEGKTEERVRKRRNRVFWK
jgi:hypothetical protein